MLSNLILVVCIDEAFGYKSCVKPKCILGQNYIRNNLVLWESCELCTIDWISNSVWEGFESLRVTVCFKLNNNGENRSLEGSILIKHLTARLNLCMMNWMHSELKWIYEFTIWLKKGSIPSNFWVLKWEGNLNWCPCVKDYEPCNVWSDRVRWCVK